VKVEGTYTFAATREVVFGMLLDPDVLAKSMPGASEMKRVAHEHYEGKLKVGVGSITAAEFELAVTLGDMVEPERYAMLIDGRGKFGFTRGSAMVRLAPDAAGTGTVMHFVADLQVGGKIAAVGQRLLDSISKLMTRQGLEALAREINTRIGVSGLGVGGAVAPMRPSVPEAPAIPRLSTDFPGLQPPRSPAPDPQPPGTP
jgi:carbon monoxide dehydrogenase subunit G